MSWLRKEARDQAAHAAAGVLILQVVRLIVPDLPHALSFVLPFTWWANREFGEEGQLSWHGTVHALTSWRDMLGWLTGGAIDALCGAIIAALILNLF